jgi:hypothetical protein
MSDREQRLTRLVAKLVAENDALKRRLAGEAPRQRSVPESATRELTVERIALPDYLNEAG